MSRTSPAPRDSASSPTAPEPAYRSSTAAPSNPPRIASTVANRPSLVRSLVGLVVRPAVVARRRPPAMIRSPAATSAHRQPAHAFSRNVVRSTSIRARTASASPGASASAGSAATSLMASARACSIRSASRSRCSSFRLDLRPAWTVPSTSPSRRCSRSIRDSAKPSSVPATASSRALAGAASGASVTRRHRPGSAPRPTRPRS